MASDLVARAENLADVLGVPASARFTRQLVRETLAETYEEGHSDGYGQGQADERAHFWDGVADAAG